MNSPFSSPVPSPGDYERLLAFRSTLCAEGYQPIRQWKGGEQTESGAVRFHWPQYDEATIAFFRAAGEAVWTDFRYVPVEAARMIADHDLVRNATLAQVRTMLTYCVRGERFCDGHWGVMIETGTLCTLLQRLAILYEETRAEDGR